jgi:hypothetical protein
MEKIKTLILALLLTASLGIFVLWGLNLAGDAFPSGVFASQEESSLPIFHLTAELLMAGITISGVIGYWRRKTWGKGLLLLGMGMFTYSAINSMGWAVINDPLQAVPMGITLVLVIILLPIILKSK